MRDGQTDTGQTDISRRIARFIRTAAYIMTLNFRVGFLRLTINAIYLMLSPSGASSAEDCGLFFDLLTHPVSYCILFGPIISDPIILLYSSVTTNSVLRLYIIRASRQNTPLITAM